jgi:hypothetical protein
MRAPRLAVLLTTLLLAVPAFAAEPAAGPMALESVLLFPVDGDLDLDAAGNVTDVRFTSPIADDVRAGLDRVVRQWDFEPVLDAGQPVAARTKVKFVLAAEPAPVVTQLRLDNMQWREVSVAGREPVKRITLLARRDAFRRPKFPPGVWFAGVSGRVLVAAHVGADGKVLAAQPVQTALYDVNGRPAVLRDAVDQLETAVMRVARGWRFDVTPAPGITPTVEDMTVYVPVIFRGQGYTESKTGQWRLLVRTPRREPTWFAPDPSRLGVGVADVAGEDPATTQQGPRLLSGGPGQSL